MALTAGLILAGGHASRMGGGDKPLLRLGGTTLLERLISTLRPQAPLLALSANGDPARFAGYGLPVLADAAAGQGPLAGLLAGLRWAAEQGAEALLTVPGDTPFIPCDLLQELEPPPASAASLGRRHHLVALWPVGARAALASFLAAPGSRAVAAFADRLGQREVAFPVGLVDPFLNINTPADLATAERLLHV